MALDSVSAADMRRFFVNAAETASRQRSLATEAQLLYKEVLEAQASGNILPGLLDKLAGVRKLAPNRASPCATQATLSAHLFQHTGNPAYLARARQGLAAGRNLGGIPEMLTAQIDVAIAASDADLAHAGLKELRAAHPDYAYRDLYTARVLHFIDGRTEEAIKLLSNLESPSVHESAFLAFMAWKVGRPAEADRYLQGITKTTTVSEQAAQTELVYGDPATAEQMYEQLLVDAPTASNLCNLATAQLLQQRFLEAYATYLRAVDAGLQSPVVEVNLGDAKAGQGDRAAARGHYQAAVDSWTTTPPDPRGEDLYAYALSRVDRIPEARERMARVVEAYPDSPITRWCAWNVALTAGDTEDAAAQKAAAQGRGLSQWWFELGL